MSLEHLKAGDRVYINSRYSGIRFYKIDRVTKTQIIIGKTKYNKSGYQIGSYSIWDREYLQEITPEIIAKYNIQRLKLKIEGLDKIKITEDNYSDILFHVDQLVRYLEK